MLDGVGLDGSMAASLDKVPDEIPIYQLAAPAYFWNQNGVGSTALQQARPDRFIGVVLEGGSHVDAMRGGNQLIQFSQELVAGFTEARNVEAAKILMVGWINDMFDPAQEPEGIYGDPGDVITIDTPAGVATAIALPSSLTKWHLFNLLAAVRGAGERVLHLRTDVRHRHHDGERVPGADGCMTPDRCATRVNGKLHTKHRVIS